MGPHNQQAQRYGLDWTFGVKRVPIGPAVAQKPIPTPITPPETPPTGAIQPLQTAAKFPSMPRPRLQSPLPVLPMPPINLPPGYETLTSPIADVKPRVAPVAPTAPGPGAGGYSPIAPGSPAYVRETPAGRIENIPQFQTDYTMPGGTMTVTGPSQRAGGGTLSVVSGVDPAQTKAAARRVADYDRATAALRSLREARNPGITGGGGGAPSLESMIAASDPFRGRNFMLDPLYGGLSAEEKALAPALRNQAALNATQQYADLVKAAQGSAGEIAGVEQKAQEAQQLDARERAKLNLEADKFAATAPAEAQLRQAQAAKAGMETQRMQRAAALMDLLKKVSPEEAAKLGPEGYRDLMEKYAALEQGKIEPAENWMNALMLGR